MRSFALLALFACTLLITSCYGQEIDSVRGKKLKRFVVLSALGYGAAMTALGQIWYSDYDKQSFRFFNDSREWYQADKLGHAYASYHLSSFIRGGLSVGGLSDNRANNMAAISSFLAVSSIELFDGHSSGYGASASDLVANAAGVLIFWSQQKFWGQQRITMKYSFHRTHYPPIRPSVLGSNLMEEIVKDYNGQTAWASVDVDKFVRFPKWLNVAIGYGVQDFVFASVESNIASGYSPYRQYYLGLDIDVSDIPTKSKLVKVLLHGLGAIRLPAPALEYGRSGWKFHTLYF